MVKFIESDYSFYKIRTGNKRGYELSIEKPYEGTIHLIDEEHGGERYESVEFIEFDSNPSPEEIEEIQKFVEINLFEIMEKAEKI